MIDRLALASWLALTPSHLVDETPLHNRFTNAMLTHEAADAMATACAEADPFPLDTDGRLCGAFLVVMAGLESGFSLHPQGSNDHGHAAGPFQEWRGGDERSASWIRATRHYLATVRDAIRFCPEQPIAQLAGEMCGRSAIHERRWHQVERILAEVSWAAP